MERKKIQRIIGILVVIALVIILLPLLFNKKHRVLPEETVASVVPPPFPVVQEQVSQAVPVNSLQDVIKSDQFSQPVSQPASQPIKSPIENDLNEPRELKEPPVVKYTKNENNQNKASKPAINPVTNKLNIAKKNNAKKNVIAKKPVPHLASAKHIKPAASAKIITASVKKNDIAHHNNHIVHKSDKTGEV